MCPKCYNRQWSHQILVTGTKAWCSKCGYVDQIKLFLTNTGNPMSDDKAYENIFGPNGKHTLTPLNRQEVEQALKQIGPPETNSFAPPFNPGQQIEIPYPIIGEKDAEILAQGGTQFETGAVRSSDKANVRYDLISPIGMRRLAETMEEGRQKYGYFNWERGMPIGDILNHAIAHIYAYLAGEPTGEDDLAHAAWNLFAAMHMEETHPNLQHQLRPEHPINKKDTSSC